ncbi:hypothetical protein V8E55_009315 [Tylopilus felleus]
MGVALPYTCLYNYHPQLTIYPLTVANHQHHHADLSGILRASGIGDVTATDAILSTYTAPGEFPTSIYASYWNNPTATSAQPQPVISDPVTSTIFPANLTDPANFPKNDTVDPHPPPLPQEPSQLLQQAFTQIQSMPTTLQSMATRTPSCRGALRVLHASAQTFDILDAYTSAPIGYVSKEDLLTSRWYSWISRVNEFPELDNQT